MTSVGGDIELMPVADAAMWAASRQLTGTLSVRRRGIEAHFTLRKGVCVQASSSDPREYLGQHLINFNHIDEDQLQRAFDTQKETRVPLGRVLVMVDAVTTEQLQKVLTFKTREGLLEVMCWTEGHWRLSLDVDENTELDCDMPVDLREVASEGAARQQMWTEIRRVFPSDATRVDVLVTPDDVDSSFDRRLLQLMQTGRSVGEAALELRAMDFQTYARLYDLANRNLVRALLTSTAIRLDHVSPQALAASGVSIVTGPSGKPMVIPRAATPAQGFSLVVPRMPSGLNVPASFSFSPHQLPTSTAINPPAATPPTPAIEVAAKTPATTVPKAPTLGPLPQTPTPAPATAPAKATTTPLPKAPTPPPLSPFAVPAAFATAEAPGPGPAFPSTLGVFPRPSTPLRAGVPSPFASVPDAPTTAPPAIPSSTWLPSTGAPSAKARAPSAKVPSTKPPSTKPPSTKPPSNKPTTKPPSSTLPLSQPGDDDEMSFAIIDDVPTHHAPGDDDDLDVSIETDHGIDISDDDEEEEEEEEVGLDVELDDDDVEAPTLAPFPTPTPTPTPTPSPTPTPTPSKLPKSTTPLGSYFGAGTYMMVRPERASEAPGVKIPPEAEDPAQALRLALAGRNWSEAMLLSQRILEHDPLDSEAIAAFRVADAQLRRIEKQGGASTEADFRRVPTLAMARDEVALSHLTSKERYVLSRVDGRRSLEQIAAVSPIQRQELVRIVDSFVQRGVLSY